MIKLKGIFHLTWTCYCIWHEFSDITLDRDKWIPKVTDFGNAHPILEMPITLFFIFSGIFVFYFFFKGLGYTFYLGNMSQEGFDESAWGQPKDWSILNPFNWYRILFKESYSSNDSDTSNIDRVKAYRESKLSTMSNEKAASEYKKTAWIDGLDANPGSNVSSAKKYINSKLSTMSNETAYQWLKSRK